MKKEKIILKLIIAISIPLVLCITIFFIVKNTINYKVYDNYEDFWNNYHNYEEPNKLHTIYRVDYDEKTLSITWDPVIKEDAYIVYKIKIGNKEYDVGSNNSYFYIPNSDSIEVSVKAIDQTNKYQSSDYDKLYINFENSSNIYIKLKALIGKSYYEINYDEKLKIIFVEFDDGSLNVTYSNETNKIITKELHFKSNVYTIDDVLNTECSGFSSGSYWYNYIFLKYTCDYDSTSYFLKSNANDGLLDEYRNNGYSITPITSVTADNDYNDNGPNNYYIAGVFKVQKDDDIKYISACYYITITNPSEIIEENFTTKLLDKDNYNITIKKSKILTEEYNELFQILEQIKTIYNVEG